MDLEEPLAVRLLRRRDRRWAGDRLAASGRTAGGGEREEAEEERRRPYCALRMRQTEPVA
jgi:hypothetical protein